MKFSSREDVEASPEVVFGAVTDFDRFERLLRRRGAQVRRLDGPVEPRAGMAWAVRFEFRSKERRAQAEVRELTAPECLRMSAQSNGISADFIVELIALSRTRTRVKVGLDLRPKTLPARLLIQSLKFTKSSLDRRFSDRFKKFCRGIETGHDPARAMRLG